MPPVDFTGLLNFGAIGSVLAWMLWRSDARMNSIERALDRLTRAQMLTLIAHEAWHAHQHSQGRRYYGRQAEQEAWALQACVLADLSPGNLAVPWLLGSIATLPDGGPLHGNPEV